MLRCRFLVGLALAGTLSGVCLAQAISYAMIKEVHLGRIGDPWLVDPSGRPETDTHPLVRLSNGGEVELPSIEGQVDFSMIEISRDRHMIGWAVEQNVCSQNYSCPTEVRIRRADGSIGEFAPNAGTIWDWAFSPDGTRVVLHSGPTHGDDQGIYTLFASDTAHVVGHYAISADAPNWVRDYLNRFVR